MVENFLTVASLVLPLVTIVTKFLLLRKVCGQVEDALTAKLFANFELLLTNMMIKLLLIKKLHSNTVYIMVLYTLIAGVQDFFTTQ